MKIHGFALVAALLSSTAPAQNNTYPFPASGNVGIGTPAPQTSLQIYGPFTPAYMQLSLHATGSDNRTGLSFWSTTGSRVGVLHLDGDGNYVFGKDGPGHYLFYSNGAEAMRINSTGNVGIGTANPQARLEIGAVGANSPSLIIGKNNFVGFRRSDASLVYGIGHDATDGVFRIGASPALSPGAGTDIDINSGGYRISLSQGGVERMRVDTGGNVGIGTTTPDSRLHVNSSGGLSGLHINASGDAGTPAIIYENSWSTGAKWLTAIDHSGDLFLGTKVVGASQYAFAVTYSGNVGIGTTNPTHKLAVNGTIKAKEVIVETTGWSDYVFADDYALQPLSEVEAHIKTKKHLPGIPSAVEVAEQGVSVGDMQARLLAKIEELTLHQIAQEKSLKAEARELRALLAAQAEELTALRAEVRGARQP
jgi:hypothetical protein